MAVAHLCCVSTCFSGLRLVFGHCCRPQNLAYPFPHRRVCRPVLTSILSIIPQCISDRVDYILTTADRIGFVIEDRLRSGFQAVQLLALVGLHVRDFAIPQLFWPHTRLIRRLDPL